MVRVEIADQISINDVRLDMPIPAEEVSSVMQYLLREMQFHIQKDGIEFLPVKRILRDTKKYTKLHQPLTELTNEFAAYLRGRLGVTVTISTVKRFQQLANRLKEFDLYSERQTILREVDDDFMQRFIRFITEVKGSKMNSACSYCINLCKVLTHALQCGEIPRDPLPDFHMSPRHEQMPILTEKEVERIKKLIFIAPDRRLCQQLFLIQCYTGLSYCDLQQLSQSHFSENEFGDEQMLIHRKKTGKRSLIPLLHPVTDAIAVIGTLSLSKYKLIREGMLPMPSCIRYNYLLKEIGAAAKIKIPITTHMGRRTFASSIAYAYGASIQTVGTVLGHNKLRTTVQYARVTNEKIKKEMKGMNK